MAFTVAAVQESVDMLHGRKEFPEAVKEMVKKSGSMSLATAMVAYLFG
jgi:hypothetical protein